MNPEVGDVVWCCVKNNTDFYSGLRSLVPPRQVRISSVVGSLAADAVVVGAVHEIVTAKLGEFFPDITSALEHWKAKRSRRLA